MSALEHTEISPAERRRLKVRGSILEAAERVFAELGEEGLSIRRLAEEIDYSPAAIYKYFGSKEELIDELKEAFFERILGQIDIVKSCSEPFPARARMCVKAYINTALEKPHHYMAAFTTVPDETSDTTPPLSWSEFTTSNKGRAFAYLVSMVEEGQSLGHFRAELDPMLAAKSLWAASHGLAQLMAHIPHFRDMLPDRPTLDTENFIALHADIIIRGLETQPSGPQGQSHD